MTQDNKQNNLKYVEIGDPIWSVPTLDGGELRVITVTSRDHPQGQRVLEKVKFYPRKGKIFITPRKGLTNDDVRLIIRHIDEILVALAQ